MHGPQSEKINKLIISLANEGLTTQQIADEVGMKRGAVGSRMSRMIGEGRLQRQSVRNGNIDSMNTRSHILSRRHKKLMGSMSELMINLTIKEADLLFKTTPKGITVAEWCAVLMRDVIAEGIE
jgi:orotate phosphoribosyltransferase-like protein